MASTLWVLKGCLKGWRLKTPSSSEAVPVVRNYTCRDLQVAKSILWAIHAGEDNMVYQRLLSCCSTGEHVGDAVCLNLEFP